MNKANECTCPSGDGSLVHPCPAHPAVEQVGGDERAAFEAAFAAMGRPVCRADYDQDAYGTPFDDGGWTGWQARAALAQPSPVRSSLLINGYQLRAALDFIAPDGTAEQLESEACIEWRQQDADFLEAGLYAFCAEYPEEGGVLLDEEPTTAQPSPLQSEQAEAERSALWAVHAQGPDELYAAFSREDAEKHAAELNALPMPEGIAVGAVVVPSPWPAVQHWQYLAEQEQDHKNEIAGRLRQHERIGEALRAEIAEWQEAAGRSRSDVVAYIAERAKLLEERDSQQRLAIKAMEEVAALRSELQTQRERNTELIFKLGSATNGWGRCEKERDAALARVAEYEAQGQHSVPGNAAALVRAEAKKYSLNAAGMLDSGAPEHAQTFAIVQLLSEFDDEEAESHWEAIMAYSDFRTSDALFRAAELLAAAPGKEVGHE
ncbi:TPA: hypothetical protein NH712_001411 [Pseudomonas aeruginosa]|uniref:hypothetical protein n=1 Tax=Pseudomonas aeruginosa TaxID=287 RepID=UPI00068C37BB|nr:hypothetical protein [Pseudomonas aeruginosa]HCF0768801.1 hypothetical protein [Pseudomonas aeruginosa]HCL3771944.1 hypothetical protein [Pseudomonas aeruginosa]